MKRKIKTNFGTSSEEFEYFVGRKPTKKEFDEWVHYMENGVDAQLDWGIIAKCAAENFKKEVA